MAMPPGGLQLVLESSDDEDDESSSNETDLEDADTVRSRKLYNISCAI